MCHRSVLPEKDPLPSAQGEPPIDDGDRLAAPSECHLDVARHIVRTFHRVDKVRIIGRHEAIHPPFQVMPRRRIRVFHENEAAGSMAAEDVKHAMVDVRLRDQPGAAVGDFDEARPVRLDRDGFVNDRHDERSRQKTRGLGRLGHPTLVPTTKESIAVGRHPAVQPIAQTAR